MILKYVGEGNKFLEPEHIYKTILMRNEDESIDVYVRRFASLFTPVTYSDRETFTAEWQLPDTYECKTSEERELLERFGLKKVKKRVKVHRSHRSLNRKKN